ncbi:FYVE, RhoGEF and PH domain-containing protein 6-like [Oncorhynchus nerka]|uniref:FYVE, RhoGEF and PH domain-containing protein 6-like n=1 Tax=Oncorhynchus nerka TaxID=8023 RepID=UPI0031B851FB
MEYNLCAALGYTIEEDKLWKAVVLFDIPQKKTSCGRLGHTTEEDKLWCSGIYHRRRQAVVLFDTPQKKTSCGVLGHTTEEDKLWCSGTYHRRRQAVVFWDIPQKKTSCGVLGHTTEEDKLWCSGTYHRRRQAVVFWDIPQKKTSCGVLGHTTEEDKLWCSGTYHRRRQAVVVWDIPQKKTSCGVLGYTTEEDKLWCSGTYHRRRQAVVFWDIPQKKTSCGVLGHTTEEDKLWCSGTYHRRRQAVVFWDIPQKKTSCGALGHTTEEDKLWCSGTYHRRRQTVVLCDIPQKKKIKCLFTVEMEQGAAQVDKEEEEEGRNEEEEIHDKISCHPLATSLSKQLELSSNCHFPLTLITTGSYKENESAQNKMAGFPKKLQRCSSPEAWVLKNELSEEREVGERKTSDSDDDGGALTKATKAMRKLPATPGEDKPKRNRIFQTLVSPVSRKRSTDNTQTKGSLPTDETLSPSRPSRSRRGKQKAKSFSSADLTPSEGQKWNSFRRLLDLKLSVKRLPKLLAKGGQSLDTTAAEAEQYADDVFQDRGVCFQERLGIRVGDARKFSCPQLGVIGVGVGAEQSVDGDEIHYPGAEQAVEYENVPYYEAIPEYFIQPVGLGLRGSELGVGTPPDQSECHNHLYDDADIYEEQEPYHPLKRHSEHSSTEEFFYEEQEPYHPLKRRSEQQLNQHSSTERSSIDEDVGPLDEGQSDEDVMVQSSDEEDDESSSSSKGEPEKPEEREAGSGAKRNKIVHIAREIMSSENVFVNVLKLLHIDFRDAVAKASRPSGKPIIEEAILNQILYYLPQLYELNQDLLRELEDRVAQWDEHGRLADIFVKKGPYLKMYSTYIREFDKNVALLDEHSRKNPAFAAVVREFEAGPRCASLALRHYLLKPVQRIPQYQMLLTDYLKNLSPDSADYKDTQAALGIVKEVANHANDIMKQGDNFQKLIQVQCRLNGHHEIVLPGRVFLKEGVLMKLSRKVMQPRMFFLFNDTLLYTTPVQSGQFKLNNMLSLTGMKVSKPSQEAFQNELTIESVERSFILSGSSAVERDDWLEAISTAINDYTRKKISFISSKTLEETGSEDSGSGAPLGSKAPIWIPDPRATMCMVCTCEFTLTWRRHHCRACGKVVCQSCSSNKHCLEYLKNQLARVCDQCFIVLQQRSEKDLSATLSPGGKSSFAFARKTKKIPAALKEVSANTDNSSMSGYLQRSKGIKKQGKRLWFVIKNKVLYTYAASEDVAALESQPLLGFMLKEEEEGAGPPVQKQQFKLYHKNTLHYIFKADDSQTAQRWIDAFKEAMVL